MPPILQEPHALLRKKSLPVAAAQIGSLEINKIISELISALEQEFDGVAIAAPQLGYSYRIFVVSKKVWKGEATHRVFINPFFVRQGKTKKEMSEGCLSVRWKYGMVKRSTTATVRAQNEKGNEFVMTGRGLLAQIFQHEIDHLDGTLFIDSAKDIQDIPPAHA